MGPPLYIIAEQSTTASCTVFAWPLLNLSPFPARYPAYGSCGTETVLIKKVSYKFNWVNASVQTKVRFCTSAEEESSAE